MHAIDKLAQFREGRVGGTRRYCGPRRRALRRVRQRSGCGRGRGRGSSGGGRARGWVGGRGGGVYKPVCVHADAGEDSGAGGPQEHGCCEEVSLDRWFGRGSLSGDRVGWWISVMCCSLFLLVLLVWRRDAMGERVMCVLLWRLDSDALSDVMWACSFWLIRA